MLFNFKTKHSDEFITMINTKFSEKELCYPGERNRFLMYQILKDNFKFGVNSDDEIGVIKDLIHTIRIDISMGLIKNLYNDAINNLIENIGRDNMNKIFVLKTKHR